MKGPRYHVKTRRRREGKTNYRKRLNMLRSRKIRVVVRKSIQHTNVQFIEYLEGGDKIIASAVSKELAAKYQWKFSTATTPAAYLTGLLAGKRAAERGISESILDVGRHPPVTGSKVFAALKGVSDAGITCPYDEGKIPNEERLYGGHLKQEMKPIIEEIKSKIMGGK
ncbi:MAG: 50S ribosomal protein L18 [Candidatus Thermoplasmatota archaeon]|nr:50S ribosomal protein L18 [Candidatus Thermoplasmatota archaeon]